MPELRGKVAIDVSWTSGWGKNAVAYKKTVYLSDNVVGEYLKTLAASYSKKTAIQVTISNPIDNVKVGFRFVSLDQYGNELYSVAGNTYKIDHTLGNATRWVPVVK